MPPLPPLSLVLDKLQHLVLPGAAGAALVMCLFLLFGRWTAAIGSAVAVAGAFMWGNFVNADPPSWDYWLLTPWKPTENAAGPRWIPHAALVLVAVGLVSRWLGLIASRLLPERAWWGANILVWLPRIGAIAAVSEWLVLGEAAKAPQWAYLRWELASVILLIWIVLDGLARSDLSAEISAYLAAALFAGGAVLLYTHNGTFMELAVLVGSAMFGIAVATKLAKPRLNVEVDTTPDYNPYPDLYDIKETPKTTEPTLNASGAIPAAVMFLVGLVIGTRPSHAEHKVPVECFWLVALAPLALMPFLIPWVARQNRWVLLVLRALLFLAPLVVAVVLAGQHEQLAFEE